MNAPAWVGDDDRELSDPPVIEDDTHDDRCFCPLCQGVEIEPDDDEAYL